MALGVEIHLDKTYTHDVLGGVYIAQRGITLGGNWKLMFVDMNRNIETKTGGTKDVILVNEEGDLYQAVYWWEKKGHEALKVGWIKGNEPSQMASNVKSFKPCGVETTIIAYP